MSKRRNELTPSSKLRSYCTHKGCNELAHWQQLCKPHWYELRNRQPPKLSVIRTHNTHGLPCKEPFCDNPARTKEYCQTHYQQLRRLGAFGGRKCSTKDCTNVVEAKGLCYQHYIEHKKQRKKPGRTDIR
jgi:hypothetical protein